MFPGGECEHLHAGLTAVPVLGINTFFDIGDHIFERTFSRLDIGVGHAHDRRMPVINGAGIAGGFLTHFRSGFAECSRPVNLPSLIR